VRPNIEVYELYIIDLLFKTLKLSYFDFVYNIYPYIYPQEQNIVRSGMTPPIENYTYKPTSSLSYYNSKQGAKL
jgi:hypothetical protein